MKNKQKNKQNNVFWLGFVSYFTDLSSEMLMPILPIFYESIGLNKFVIGLIEGAAESFSSFMKVVSGYISDKLKKRKMFIIIGYALPAFMKPLYLLVSNWWQVFIVRFFERSGKGFRDPPRDALIASSVDQKNYGIAFGFQRMMDTFGAVSGVIVLTVFLHFYPDNFYPLFIIAFFPGVISFLIAGKKVTEDKKADKIKKRVDLKAVNYLPARFRFFLIPTFIFGLGNMSYAFFILRAGDLGMTITFIPAVYLIYTITYAAFAMPAGKLSDMIGEIPTLILGNLFFLIACLLFVTSLPVSLIWIVFILYGMFFAFNVSMSKSYISKVVSLDHTATAVGIHNFVLGICSLPASLVVGLLWNQFNPTVAFGYSAILTVLSTVLYFVMAIIFRKKKA